MTIISLFITGEMWNIFTVLSTFSFEISILDQNNNLCFPVSHLSVLKFDAESLPNKSVSVYELQEIVNNILEGVDVYHG